ncbi:glycoside hydrolase family 13 protein [Parasporobacterium paucivorans]|uniref:Pullulanase n=1 Tax=Parasporobacterium paucivorans DSM 15970 TaxID=1122934 RepID=A0A1M6G6I3_9FIRM|nr:glycoside hydrolase family 13 protein [Parasporobacterium paucivorans]SHJ05544.1 pullulanase [Parasporobacterium paucivorans DSM 15970]
MYKFESRSELFRHPQGALRENESICLRIHVRRDWPKAPSLLIEKRSDYTTSFYRKLDTEWVGACREYDIFQSTFSIDKSGHYYFSFLFDESNRSPSYGIFVYDFDFHTPLWTQGGIIYHVFVDRFFRSALLHKEGDILLRDSWGGYPRVLPDEKGDINNNEFFGGNLDGIRQKLPFFSTLGITILYLSPVFEAYSSHKYDTGDYFSIDPLFGTKDSLHSLCEEAANMGIRIILDGVFSHTGSDSIYFNRYGHYDSLGAYQSQDSPYFDWYTFNHWNDDYRCWWGIKTLPELNKSNQSYVDFITGTEGVVRYWQEAGISGWRLDVADELPNDFLERIRTASKESNPESLIIGEVWEDASEKFSYGRLKEYFCGKQLDSVTNYPLRTAIIDYLETRDCGSLYETMGFITEKYPAEVVNCLMNILGTHDTPRILTVLKKNIPLLKIAILLQMTLPGIPCIYYGDEAGLEGEKDPMNRACYPWGEENMEILSYYRHLADLRKKSPLFKGGAYRCLFHEKGLFVFERYHADERIVIGINMGTEGVILRTRNRDHELPPEQGIFISD